MKNIALGLLMAITISTPALASWRDELFSKIDTNANAELSFVELEATGCKVNPKFFIYADTDGSNGLNKSEFYNNRNLFSRCK